MGKEVKEILGPAFELVEQAGVEIGDAIANAIEKIFEQK